MKNLIVRLCWILIIWVVPRYVIGQGNPSGSLEGSGTCRHGNSIYRCSICDQEYLDKQKRNTTPEKPSSTNSKTIYPGQNSPSTNQGDFVNGGTIDFTTPAQRAAIERAQKQAEKVITNQKLNNTIQEVTKAFGQGQLDAVQNTQDAIRDSQRDITDQYRSTDKTGLMERSRQNEINTDNLTLADDQSAGNSFNTVNEHLSGINDIVQNTLPEHNAVRGVLGTSTTMSNLGHSVWDSDAVEFQQVVSDDAFGLDLSSGMYGRALGSGLTQEAANVFASNSMKLIDGDATLDEAAMEADLNRVYQRGGEAVISQIPGSGSAYNAARWASENRNNIANAATTVGHAAAIPGRAIRNVTDNATDFAATQIVDATQLTGKVIVNAPDLVNRGIEAGTTVIAEGLVSAYQLGDAVLKQGNDVLSKYIFK